MVYTKYLKKIYHKPLLRSPQAFSSAQPKALRIVADRPGGGRPSLLGLAEEVLIWIHHEKWG